MKHVRMCCFTHAILILSFFRYRRELPGLPVLPEMVFPTNYVRVEHVCGAKVEFNALDALKMVSTTEEPLQVAGAVQWRRSRRYLQQYVVCVCVCVMISLALSKSQPSAS